MAEEDNSQDKTEEPSQRKLDKAAEDGQVLSSKEMFVFTSLIMGLMVLSSIPFLARDLLAISDRAIILANKKIIAQGTPTELVNNISARNLYFGDAFKIS